MKQYDLVIIGGGTVGLAVGLDASLRGLSVAILEKGRVGKQTNDASLGIVHSGGLNYVHKDIDLVRMNAVDAGLMKGIFGDILQKQKFLIPVFPKSKYPLWLWDGYLSAYDNIAHLGGVNPHKKLSKSEIFRQEYSLKKNLTGGIMFEEWVVDPAFLADTIAEAILNRGGKIYEHTRVCGSLWHLPNRGSAHSQTNGREKIKGLLTVRNQNGKEVRGLISGKYFINAAGPWAPRVLPNVFGLPSFETRLTRGTSIIVKGRFTRNALIIFDRKGKYITVLPLGHNRTLIGPTNCDVSQEVSKNPDKLKPGLIEKEELLSLVFKYFRLQFSEVEVVETKCGLRPQLNHPKVKPDDITHEFAIIDHEEKDEVVNLSTIFGGKLSGQLRMAKEVVDLVCKKLSFDGKKEWIMPYIKIKKGKVFEACHQDCGSRIHYYGKSYALSFKDKAGKIAKRKRIKSIFYLIPFIIYGFAMGILGFMKKPIWRFRK